MGCCWQFWLKMQCYRFTYTLLFLCSQAGNYCIQFKWQWADFAGLKFRWTNDIFGGHAICRWMEIQKCRCGYCRRSKRAICIRVSGGWWQNVYERNWSVQPVYLWLVQLTFVPTVINCDIWSCFGSWFCQLEFTLLHFFGYSFALIVIFFKSHLAKNSWTNFRYRCWCVSLCDFLREPSLCYGLAVYDRFMW